MKRADILLFIFAVGWLFLMGNEVYQRNNVWKSSVNLWEDCIRRCPTDLAFVQLGNAYLERRKKFDIDKAIMCYNSAIKTNRKNALAWRNCGSAYMLQNKTELAKEFYIVALGLEPKLEDAKQIRTVINLLNQNKEVNIKWR
jgi:tetratricopeptide (TPR) repeat protein